MIPPSSFINTEINDSVNDNPKDVCKKLSPRSISLVFGSYPKFSKFFGILSIDFK